MNLSMLKGEEKQFLARLSDLYHISKEKEITRFTDFCNERQVIIAREFARQTGANHLLYGGYPCAMRKTVGFFPISQLPSEDNFPIQAVNLHLPKGASLSHRDYLGTLISLGLKRNSIGDIIAHENRCILFLLNSVTPVVLENLKKVGGTGIKAELNTKDFELPNPQYMELRGTVSSIRLDCLVRLLTGTAREKSAAIIKAELVTLNYRTAASVRQSWEQNDIIAIRGYGKFKVSEIGHPTRKGRLPVVCLKYI